MNTPLIVRNGKDTQINRRKSCVLSKNSSRLSYRFRVRDMGARGIFSRGGKIHGYTFSSKNLTTI